MKILQHDAKMFQKLLMDRLKMSIKIELMLKTWQKNKRSLYYLFNNSLTVEYPIEIIPTITEISDKKRELMAQEYLYSSYLEHISEEEFRDNRLYDDVKINQSIFRRGTKVSKILSKIAQNKEDTDRLQTKYSMILQQFKIKGQLCLSINPIDYLTMSENYSNWATCMNLNGVFSAGTLSLMNDMVTIVAYVKSDKFEIPLNSTKILPNNKKWRQLIHIDLDNNTVIFNKHYPQRNDYIEDIAKNKLKTLISEYKNEEIEWEEINDYTKIVGYVMNHENSLHYNDIDEIDSKASLICSKENINNLEPIQIGEAVLCPVCGEHYLDMEGNFICTHCVERLDLKICDVCHKVLMKPEDIHMYGDETEHDVFCKECFNHIYFTCSCCEGVMPRLNIGAPNRQNYIIDENGNEVCNFCSFTERIS